MPRPRVSRNGASLAKLEPVMENKRSGVTLASASEINSWKKNLQRNIKRGHKQGIMWAIEDAESLGLPDDHPDVVAAQRVLASLPNGEGFHPTRTEITAMEPMCARWAEGSLAKAAVYGDAESFNDAMGEFIRMMEFLAPIEEISNGNGKRSKLSGASSTCSTASTSSVREALITRWTWDNGSNEQNHIRSGHFDSILADLWRSADIDGNGLMSESEARETLRVFLSRPQLRDTLGEPLKTVITNRMARDEKFAEHMDLQDPLSDCLSYMIHDRVLKLCKHAVSKACLDVAKNLHEMTDSFWAAMDLSKNGEVDRDEFLASFDNAIRRVVLTRLWKRAEERAWKMAEAGCWNCTTTEQMDGMLKAHIQKESEKKKQKTVTLETLKLPSAKDEAAEFCQAGDCVVM